MDLVMTDQDLIFCALRQVGLIVAEHIESGSSDADEVVTQLIAVLDTEELAGRARRPRWNVATEIDDKVTVLAMLVPLTLPPAEAGLGACTR